MCKTNLKGSRYLHRVMLMMAMQGCLQIREIRASGNFTFAQPKSGRKKDVPKYQGRFRFLIVLFRIVAFFKFNTPS